MTMLNVSSANRCWSNRTIAIIISLWWEVAKELKCLILECLNVLSVFGLGVVIVIGIITKESTL